MNGELKACPFCGQSKHDSVRGPYVNATGESFVVVCGKCGASSDYYSRTGSAIEAWNTRAVPTPAPGALPELIESRLRYLERFSDEGQHKSIPGPYAGSAWELAQDLRMAIPAYARAYAEQCSAGVVVTDEVVRRSLAEYCRHIADDIDKGISPIDQSKAMRAALQSAFADDEGVKNER